jgi:hypothetical protein
MAAPTAPGRNSADHQYRALRMPPPPAWPARTPRRSSRVVWRDAALALVIKSHDTTIKTGRHKDVLSVHLPGTWRLPGSGERGASLTDP